MSFLTFNGVCVFDSPVPTGCADRAAFLCNVLGDMPIVNYDSAVLDYH